MNGPTLHLAVVDEAAEWNAWYPIGTPVHAWPGVRDDAPLVTLTRSRAWTLDAGDAVVAVDGYAGGIALSHVTATVPVTLEHVLAAAVQHAFDRYVAGASCYAVAKSLGLSHSGMADRLKAAGIYEPNRPRGARKKTHCHAGHDLAVYGTPRKNSTERYCAECKRVRQRVGGAS